MSGFALGQAKDLLIGAGVLGGLFYWMAASGPAPRGARVDPTTVADRELAEQLDRSHRLVSFSTLSSFIYDERPRLLGFDRDGRPGVPDEVLALSGQDVAIDGFILPLDYDGAGVSRFLLNASFDMCQFGAPSRVNERIDVLMTENRRTLYTHLPRRIYGRLEVREEYEGARVTNLYRLHGRTTGQPGLGYSRR